MFICFILDILNTCPHIQGMHSPISYEIASCLNAITKQMRVFRRAFLSWYLLIQNISLYNFAWSFLDILLCLQKLKKSEDVRRIHWLFQN